jgi:hypothetical protein
MNIHFKILVLVLFGFLAAIFFNSCKDNVLPPKTETDPGILMTDEFGNILGGDTTDWCLNDSGTVSFGPAYPNPSSLVIRVKFHVPVDDTVKIFILKSATDTIKYFSGLVSAGYWNVDIHDTGQYTNTFQRIYFYSKRFSSSQYCRFYGDVRFEE